MDVAPSAFLDRDLGLPPQLVPGFRTVEITLGVHAALHHIAPYPRHGVGHCHPNPLDSPGIEHGLGEFPEPYRLRSGHVVGLADGLVIRGSRNREFGDVGHVRNRVPGISAAGHIMIGKNVCL